MSTSEPVVISYRWDRENFEKAFENAYTYHYKHSLRRYIGWLFVAMTQFGVVFALKGGRFGLLLFSTILVLYWYVIKKWLVKRRALRAFERSLLKDSTITLVADEEGIVQGEVSVPWEEIRGIVVSDEALMLYLKNKEYYIPENAFGDIESKSRFKSLAQKKGKLFV
ncbi:MAG: hypothetical protein DSZ10_03530 [Sulfurovum sp.]|nr:MAG: hypothetical protein DSZ10_03530 [Sulfurovum sp.]